MSLSPIPEAFFSKSPSSTTPPKNHDPHTSSSEGASQKLLQLNVLSVMNQSFQLPSNLRSLQKDEVKDLTLGYLSLLVLPPFTRGILKIKELAPEVLEKKLLPVFAEHYGEDSKDILLEFFRGKPLFTLKVFQDAISKIIEKNELETAKMFLREDFVLSVNFSTGLKGSWALILNSAISKEGEDGEQTEKNIEITLLLIALLKGRKENFETLGSQETPLMIAAGRKEKIDVFKALVDEKVDLNRLNYRGLTALMFAASLGNLEAVKYLIEAKSKGSTLHLNYPDFDRKTALMHAVFKQQEEVVKVLVEQEGTKLDLPFRMDDKAFTPLQYLFQEHLIREKPEKISAICKLLIGKGANFRLDAPFSREGHTLFMASCRYPEIFEVTKILFEKGASINERDIMGHTPLICAVLGGNSEAVHFLLREGALSNLACYSGFTPLQYLLQEHLIKEEPESVFAIFELLIGKGADLGLNALGPRRGQTFLMNTCGYRDPNIFEVTKILFEKGANVNAQNDLGNTALICAILGGNVEAVEFLLGRGAVSNFPFHNGFTPLQYLLQDHLIREEPESVFAIFNLLIGKGANLHLNALGPCRGQTFLMNTCSYRHPKILEVAKILVEKEADVDAQNALGNTALFYAVLGGNTEAVEFLLNNNRAKANKNLPNKKGITPSKLGLIIRGVIDSKIGDLLGLEASSSSSNETGKNKLKRKSR